MKTIIQSALLLFALLFPATASAYFEVDGFNFSAISDTTVEVLTGPEASDIVIPETVTWEGKTYTVTKIGDNAFHDHTGLTSIIIPNTVTQIGTRPRVSGEVSYLGHCFANCTSLTSIVIPDNVQYISVYAFDGCTGLTDVTIGKSITTLFAKIRTINYPIFSNCDNITSLTWNAVNCANVGNMNTSNIEQLTIGPDVQTLPSNFLTDSKITSLTWNAVNCPSNGNMNTANIEQVTIGPDVQILPNNFLKESKINDITLPNSVTKIGDYAFMNCKGLTEFAVPNSVTDIGRAAFYGCENLTKVITSSIEAWCTIRFDSWASNPVLYAGHLFLNDQEIIDLIIPETIDTIKYSTFAYCTGIKSVMIPNSVTCIGDDAFYGCTSMTSVLIPNSVTSIGREAFSNCTVLADVTIPNSVTTIGGAAFEGCLALTDFVLPNSVTELGSNPIDYCTGLLSISVEEGNPVYDSRDKCNAIIETATNTLISGCQNTTIPRSVNSIAPFAFYGCENLTSIFIPNTVTSIGVEIDVYNNDTTYYFYNPFECCISLASIVVEDGNPVYDSRNNSNAIIETATNALIVGCKNTVIPNTVTAIGDFAFYYCSRLTSLTIPNSVARIGRCAFAYCWELTSIDLGDSVAFIDNAAFYNCWKLTSVTIPNSVIFTEGNYLYFQQFAYCTSLTTVTIGSSVARMSGLFWECPNITCVTCLATTPPICYTGTSTDIATTEYFYNFNDEVFEQATLYVPAESLDAYQTAYYWKNFQHIEPIPAVTGDVDGDGKVSIADVTDLIDMLLTGATSVMDYPAADVDGDGKITIADVTSLIDMLLTSK